MVRICLYIHKMFLEGHPRNTTVDASVEKIGRLAEVGRNLLTIPYCFALFVIFIGHVHKSLFKKTFNVNIINIIPTN